MNISPLSKVSISSRLKHIAGMGEQLDELSDLSAFKKWAESGKQNNTRLWMQINHPGRQVFKALGGKNIAPSAIALELDKNSRLFTLPKAKNEGIF